MVTQELVKISGRFIGRVKFTSQGLGHFSYASGSGLAVLVVFPIAFISFCSLCCNMLSVNDLKVVDYGPDRG